MYSKCAIAWLVPALLSGSVYAQASLQDFERLAVLGGLWQQAQDGGMLYERWERKSDSLFSGQSIVVRGTDTTLEETVELRLHQGEITYSPLVRGQNMGKPVTFRLREIQRSGFVFENPQHDFPQRISYRHSGDTLYAMVSGNTAKGFRAFQYAYSRVKAAPGAEALQYFAGKWRLRAWSLTEPSAAPTITATWNLVRVVGALQGGVVLSSGDTFTRERISFDPAQGQFVRRIEAADGSHYIFTTKGWQGEHLVWRGTQSLGGTKREWKAEISRKDDRSFEAVYYSLNKGRWTAVMREELQRLQH